MPKKKKGLLEGTSWKVIIEAVITVVAFYFGLPAYLFDVRPIFANRIGSDSVSFIEGAILGAITIVIVLKLYAQLTENKENTTLAEPKVAKPILRITPLLSTPAIMGNLGLDILIENIGYSIAKDIEVNCQLVPDGSIPLNDNGVFKHPLLAPRDPPIKYSALMFVESPKLLSQEKLIIEVSYLDEDDKKQKPIKMETTINKLEQEMRRVRYT